MAVNVLNKSTFSGSISSTATINNDLISPPSVNDFPCLTNSVL